MKRMASMASSNCWPLCDLCIPHGSLSRPRCFMKQTGKSIGKYGSFMGYLEISGDIMVILGILLGSGFWNLVGTSGRTSILDAGRCLWFECRVVFQHGITCSGTEVKDPKSQSHHRLKCGWVYPVYPQPTPFERHEFLFENTWRVSPVEQTSSTRVALTVGRQVGLPQNRRHLKSGCLLSFWPSWSQFWCAHILDKPKYSHAVEHPK